MVSRLAETGKPILSLRTFARFSPMRLYYLRSASPPSSPPPSAGSTLRCRRRRYHRSSPSPRPSVRPRPRRPTCSALPPFPKLIRQTSCGVFAQPMAALRNFISRRANYTPRFCARETVVISVDARRASRLDHRARILLV